MKGKLVKQENQWYVQYKMDSDLIATDGGLIPLSPYDVNQIEEDAKRFDNIEARIAAYPDVNFRIEDHWETGMEGVVQVAKLIPETDPLDLLAEQAQELDLGYGLSETEYEKACYWFGRGIHAGRNNLINELKPKRND